MEYKKREGSCPSPREKREVSTSSKGCTEERRWGMGPLLGRGGRRKEIVNLYEL